jgi:hypothetical protein
LTGSIPDWKGGTGILAIYSSDSSEVARTDLADTGSFSIKVPKDPTTLKVFVAENLSKSFTGALNCSVSKNTLTVSEPQLKILDISSVKFIKVNTNIPLNVVKTTLTFTDATNGLMETNGSQFVYADRSATVKGSMEFACTSNTNSGTPTTQTIVATVDLNYIKGWNSHAIDFKGSFGLVETNGKVENKISLSGTIKSQPAGSPMKFYTN